MAPFPKELRKFDVFYWNAAGVAQEYSGTAQAVTKGCFLPLYIFYPPGNLAFFTQGRLSVGTVVPDGPFFRNAEDSVPYGELFGFPCIKGRLTLRVLGYPSSVCFADTSSSEEAETSVKRNGQDRSLR